jgi:hypothetical protein
LPAAQPPPQQRSDGTQKHRKRCAQSEVTARKCVARLQSGVQRRQQLASVVQRVRAGLHGGGGHA